MAKKPKTKATPPLRNPNARRRLIPRSVYNGFETQEAYDRRKADEAATRAAEQRAKGERFRLACEQVCVHFRRPAVRDYWISQLEAARSEDQPTFCHGKAKLIWPKDRPVVYALMACCAHRYGLSQILPEALATKPWYEKCLKHCRCVEIFDQAKSFMKIIEQDIEGWRENTPDTHSQDYTSVRHRGQSYSFTKTQAKVVKVLFEEQEKGCPAVGQESLLEKCGSEGSRLRDVFKGKDGTHPAWQKMIVRGSKKGTFMLAPPK